jgi:hypothetical protein
MMVMFIFFLLGHLLVLSLINQCMCLMYQIPKILLEIHFSFVILMFPLFFILTQHQFFSFLYNFLIAISCIQFHNSEQINDGFSLLGNLCFGDLLISATQILNLIAKLFINLIPSHGFSIQCIHIGMFSISTMNI